MRNRSINSQATWGKPAPAKTNAKGPRLNKTTPEPSYVSGNCIRNRHNAHCTSNRCDCVCHGGSTKP